MLIYNRPFPRSKSIFSSHQTSVLRLTSWPWSFNLGLGPWAFRSLALGFCSLALSSFRALDLWVSAITYSALALVVEWIFPVRASSPVELGLISPEGTWRYSTSTNSGGQLKSNIMY